MWDLATTTVSVLLPWSSVDKESACNAGDTGLSFGSGRAFGEGNGNPLQYSCLENFMDRGARQAIVLGVTKSRTRLSDYCYCICATGYDQGFPECALHCINESGGEREAMVMRCTLHWVDKSPPPISFLLDFPEILICCKEGSASDALTRWTTQNTWAVRYLVGTWVSPNTLREIP